jgi:choline monooxygenase
MTLHSSQLAKIRQGFDPAPQRSFSLPGWCYTQPEYLQAEREAVFYRSWQFVCHLEKLREPGSYVVFEIQGRSLVALRDRDGELRAFYNVCKHRAHELLKGEGRVSVITCPYHAWAYDLNGRLRSARHTDHIENFDKDEICLTPVRVEKFCTLVFVNLDPAAPSLAEQSGDLGREIQSYAPELDRLTHAHRLTYHIESNWKNVVDNFLECYHCPVAHKDFVSLVEMDTYKVTTHGIYSSHVAKAGRSDNTAYAVEGATVTDHAVWWLWPNICILRYPGEGNLLLLNVVPTGPEATYETYDFFFLRDRPSAEQMEAIDYVDKVLQREDIDIVESVQRGMRTPGYERGRFVTDPQGSGLSEHGVHHFHGLLLEAYESLAAS